MMSSCGILEIITKAFNRITSPKHHLETNNEYDVIWDLSNIRVANYHALLDLTYHYMKIVLSGLAEYVVSLLAQTRIGSNTISHPRIVGASGEIIVNGESRVGFRVAQFLALIALMVK